MKPTVPNSPILRLRDEFDKMFTKVFDEPFLSGDFFNENNRFSPMTNIEETSETFIAEVEIPGMSTNDIEIEVSGNQLIVRGEQKTETKDEQKNYIHIERSYGSFQRAFTLPDNADKDAITAKSDKGVLYITIPKKQKDNARKIEIKEENE
ncbi:Hsp20/alpha crystallin family protein [Massilibacterium senegalense]|uniref:Hsp20/alpha crystallin family protein n=1 Tax=Massilibacterium senegalense TaxID=1632858 RepID=UPI00078358C4|nr:Hsp20/alpha crystallin family protein [Massilibacterium senegalense]